MSTRPRSHDPTVKPRSRKWVTLPTILLSDSRWRHLWVARFGFVDWENFHERRCSRDIIIIKEELLDRYNRRNIVGRSTTVRESPKTLLDRIFTSKKRPTWGIINSLFWHLTTQLWSAVNRRFQTAAITILFIMCKINEEKKWAYCLVPKSMWFNMKMPISEVRTAPPPLGSASRVPSLPIA